MSTRAQLAANENQDSALLDEDETTDETKPKDPKQKIHPEQAQLQLDLFTEFYEIYPDDIDDKQQRSAVRTTLNRVKRSIINGHVEISQGETLEVKQHMEYTEGKSTFTYKEITGAHRRQLDKVGTNDGIKRMHTILSITSNVPIHEFSKLKGPDPSRAENLAALFLLV